MKEREAKPQQEAKTRKNPIKSYPVPERTTLLEFLLVALSNKSKTTIKALLAHRQVAINLIPTTQFNAILNAGDEVQINFEKGFSVFKHNRLGVLYEDDVLLVVNKGYGLLSMSTDRIKEKTAYHILSEYVKAEHPGNRIFILHRLDRDTSGVMLFAKSQGIQETMQRNWNEMVLERKYVAVVEGVPTPPQGEIVSYLAENSAFNVYTTTDEQHGARAVTRYNTLKSNAKFALLELELETGRKNQLRVQLQSIGHSIVGDKKYGATGNPLGRLALHATKIRFVHPITRREMTFETPIPHKFSYVI